MQSVCHFYLFFSFFLLPLCIFCRFQLVPHQITEVDDVRTQRVQRIHILQQIIGILAIEIQRPCELLRPHFRGHLRSYILFLGNDDNRRNYGW